MSLCLRYLLVWNQTEIASKISNKYKALLIILEIQSLAYYFG